MGQSFQLGKLEERRRKDGTIAYRVRYWARTAAGTWKLIGKTLPRRVKTRKQAERELDKLLRRSACEGAKSSQNRQTGSRASVRLAIQEG